MKHWQSFVLLTTATLISPQVFAHVDHIGTHLTSGFINGLAHPFSSADHIITLLLAGGLIAHLSAGKIKFVILALSLLTVSYLWLHGTEMTLMNNSFAVGFITSSLTMSGLAFLMNKYFISKLKNQHA